MKTLKNIVLLMTLTSLAAVMSCGGDDPAGPTDADRFVGTWDATSVTLDDLDVTNPEYSNFSVTFNSDGSYITVDGDPVFTDTGGFWSVTSSNTTSVTLDVDGVVVVATFAADNGSVILSFTANDAVIGARTDGLVGNYVFTLSKR